MKKVILFVLTLLMLSTSQAYAGHHKGKINYSTHAQNETYFFGFPFGNVSDSTTFGDHYDHSNLSQRARHYLGMSAGQLGLPHKLWCADFMNKLVGGHDRRAVSYLHRGEPARYGCKDCVAVTSRKGGGHVGIVINYDKAGNPILISGNHGHRVGIGVYPKYRVLAYRYI